MGGPRWPADHDSTHDNRQGAAHEAQQELPKVAELVDHERLYSPAEAIKLAKKTVTTKFDPTVEVALRLGVDPRKADQMVRGTVNLPARHRQDRSGPRVRPG